MMECLHLAVPKLCWCPGAYRNCHCNSVEPKRNNYFFVRRDLVRPEYSLDA